jgi:hypothetical protein
LNHIWRSVRSCEEKGSPFRRFSNNSR